MNRLNSNDCSIISKKIELQIVSIHRFQNIQNKRIALWNRYYENLKGLEEAGKITLPTIPVDCVHNAHMFYLKAKDLEERTEFIDFMKQKDILTVFHYIPLHSAPAGLKYGRFHGEDEYTTKESERLVRLPMYYSLSLEEVDYISNCVKEFYAAK